ncbi:hypothetical protein ACM66B_003665 [Microbotryomycetes sp. NB124-2]
MSAPSTASSFESGELDRPLKKKRNPTFEFACRPSGNKSLEVGAPLLPSLSIFEGPRPMIRSVSMVRTSGVVNMNLFTKIAFDEEEDQTRRERAIGLGFDLRTTPGWRTDSVVALPWSAVDEKLVHPDHLRPSPSDSPLESSDTDSGDEGASTPPSSPLPMVERQTQPQHHKRIPLSPTTDQRRASRSN